MKWYCTSLETWFNYQMIREWLHNVKTLYQIIIYYYLFWLEARAKGQQITHLLVGSVGRNRTAEVWLVWYFWVRIRIKRKNELPVVCWFAGPSPYNSESQTATLFLCMLRSSQLPTTVTREGAERFFSAFTSTLLPLQELRWLSVR